MDVSYKRKVSNKFNFTLKLKDVFDTGGFSIMTDQSQDLPGEYYANPITNFPNGYTVEYDVLQEYLEADHRRDRRTLSVNFEYKFAFFFLGISYIHSPFFLRDFLYKFTSFFSWGFPI